MDFENLRMYSLRCTPVVVYEYSEPDSYTVITEKDRNRVAVLTRGEAARLISGWQEEGGGEEKDKWGNWVINKSYNAAM